MREEGPERNTQAKSEKRLARWGSKSLPDKSQGVALAEMADSQWKDYSMPCKDVVDWVDGDVLISFEASAMK